MNRRRFTGNPRLVVASVFVLLLLIAIILWSHDTILRLLPISPSKIHLAQEGIAKNADWKPTIQHFSNLDWALVPSGGFMMGSTENQIEEAFRACKTYGGANCPYVFDQIVQLDSQTCFETPYWINVTEVTNREYESSSSTNMVSMYRGSNWPRETVTWQEAADFCAGIGARLPTESEWEYAARGPDALLFPWGIEMNASYRQEALMLNPYDVESVDIDISWVGAQGMTGNVMEWVVDGFDAASTPRPVAPKVAQSHELRIVRGGSWASYQDFLLRTTQRIPYDSDYASSVIGFRCVHDFEATP